MRVIAMAAEGNAGQVLSVVTSLAAAVVAVPLLKRMGLGSVVGYLAAEGGRSGGRRAGLRK
ncbi:hypothetical protein [Pseudomonas sp. Seg1]|uniref:hypothetical protein n=1 Tax=Pseudomonas sp. Seg1 TaxID=2678259 RepID=UPI001BB45DA2|nr:hypothetical protein [Pseudomonas sp. Seg1]